MDETLVADALRILGSKFHSRSPLAEVCDHLAGFPPFEEMDDDDLEEVATAALERLRPHIPAGRPAKGGRGAVPRSRRVRDDLVPSAPFRFVTLPDQVVAAEPPPSLAEPLANGYCAEIEVIWAAETPLLIGAENRQANQIEPLCLGTKGGYVIPGASLRGMLRAAVEIVAFGRLGAANLHHRYGLRDFQHPAYAQRSPVSRVDEVKAGWLEWQRDQNCWTITPCGWAHVLIDDLLQSRHGRWSSHTRQSWIGLSLNEKYSAAGMARNDGTYDFTRQVSFSAQTMDNGRRVVKPAGSRTGTLVFSGKLPGKDGKKKFEYAFFAEGGQPKVIDPSVVETFKRLHSKPSKNRPIPDGSWRELYPTLERGGRVPVFYVGDLDRQSDGFFFGLTRLFKIPHERSVGEVLAMQPQHVTGPQHTPDLVEALFGFLVEPESDPTQRVAPKAIARKGRVAFSFATLMDGQQVRISDPVTLVMMAPRASFAPFYLKSEGAKDYSADPAPRLAGRKRYLPRGGGAAGRLAGIRQMGLTQLERIREASHGRPVSEDVQTRLRFLMPATDSGESRFQSRIRLHNVTAIELGAILFALTHGGDPAKPYRHMLGRARPYGAGQMRVVSARLTAQANDGHTITPAAGNEVLRDEGRQGFCPPGSHSHRPFLDAFTAFMRGKVSRDYPKVPAVQEFLGASDPAETQKLAGHLDYMPLKDFKDIRDAVKPLKPDQNGTPGAPPVSLPNTRDGRLLAAPPVSRKFWR